MRIEERRAIERRSAALNASRPSCHLIYSGRRACGRTSRGHTGGSHTGLLHLPSAMFTLFFLAIRIQPFLSLVDREVEFCVLTNQPFSICCAFFILFLFFLWGKMPFRVTARSTFVPLLIIAVFSLYEDHVVRTFSPSR